MMGEGEMKMIKVLSPKKRFAVSRMSKLNNNNVVCSTWFKKAYIQDLKKVVY